MEANFTCPKCGNTLSRYIGYKDGKPYCRLCITFNGKQADKDFKCKDNISLSLKYPLSEKQEQIALQVKENLRLGKNVLIHAVTGAGKTELVYYSMEMYLKEGKHVGFSTPRKDVVIDLKPRIEEAFPSCKVVAIYGEHTSSLSGDIIVLTTHQLYRYKNYFDLLILDEIDAFPFKGNDLLNRFFFDSIKGNYVLLSATPSKEDIKGIEKHNGVVLSLFERYHKAPLPLPEFIQSPPILSYFKVLHYLNLFLKDNKPVFIFSPTIEEGRKLFFFLRIFKENGSFVSSKEQNRRIDIEKFKAGIFKYLVTTSILERGVTVKNLQVIVYDVDNTIYNQATLVQIAGRVGRKIDATDGKVIFIGQSKTKQVEGAINEIFRYNKDANLL